MTLNNKPTQAEGLKRIIELVELEHAGCFETDDDGDYFLVDKRRERKLRKVRDILRSML